MICAWEERVSALADGELEGDVAEDVREHLAECDSCARWLSDVLQLEVLGDQYLKDALGKAVPRRSAQMPERDLMLAAVGLVLSLCALGAVLWWWAGT